MRRFTNEHARLLHLGDWGVRDYTMKSPKGVARNHRRGSCSVVLEITYHESTM